MSDMYKYSLI